MGADVAVGVGISVGKEVRPEVAASLGVEVVVGWGVPSPPQAASTIPATASEVTRAMSGRAGNLRGGANEEPLSEVPLGVSNSPLLFHDFTDCSLQFTAAWQHRKQCGCSRLYRPGQTRDSCRQSACPATLASP